MPEYSAVMDNYVGLSIRFKKCKAVNTSLSFCVTLLLSFNFINLASFLNKLMIDLLKHVN